MTRITKGITLSGPPGGDRSQLPHPSRREVHRWAGVVAAGTAVAMLAIVTVGADDEMEPSRPRIDQHGSVPATEGPVEDEASLGTGPQCLWSSEANDAVLPDPGAAPTPGSILMFERCDDEWTGNFSWLNLSGRYARTWCTVTSNIVVCASSAGAPA